MHAKVNGTYAGHFEEPNILPGYCLNSTSWYCSCLRIEGVLSGCFEPILFLIGCVCNPVTAFILLFRMGQLNRNLVFLACLSMADVLRLQQISGFRFAARGLPFLSNGRYWFVSMAHNEIACILTRTGQICSNLLMSGIFAVTSLDRLLSLTYPRRMSLITPRKAWLIMGITLVVSILLGLTWTLDLGLVYDPIMRIFRCWRRHDSNIWSLVSILFYHGKFIQILFVSFVNVAVTVKTFRIIRRRRMLQEGQAEIGLKMSQVSAAIVVAWQALFNFLANFLRSLTLLIILFANVSNDVATAQAVWPLHTIGNILSDIPCSVRWGFYLWRMPRFRAHFFAILSCRPSKAIVTEKN